jgi:hypothetical protein
MSLLTQRRTYGRLMTPSPKRWRRPTATPRWLRSCATNGNAPRSWPPCLKAVLEDTTVWEIADLLRLPRHGPFVVVAAESPQIAQEALPHADTQLRIRGIGSAWRLLPELHVGIIRLPDAGHLSQLTSVLAGTARARVGVSPAYTLLTGTAAALRFARVAMATTPPGFPAVTLFDDHPLAVAAVSAPDTMRHTAQTVLGAVLDLPPEQSTLLLQTLAAWRDNSGSATATARQMFCHPNTIRQRLRKLESCTGRSLSDPRATAELFLALEVTLLLPPSPAEQGPRPE